MIPLILGVILIVITSKIVDKVGKDAIGEFFWDAYTSVAVSPEFKALRQKQRQAIELYTQRTNTSSKDEFAKWAKLDREYGKTKTEIEEIHKSINGNKISFKRLIKAAIFVATTGTKMYIRFKYRKVAVFWLPADMFPRLVLWGLSFSSAPMGSVSVSVWLFVVNSAVDTLISTCSKCIAYGGVPKAEKAGKSSTQAGQSSAQAEPAKIKS